MIVGTMVASRRAQRLLVQAQVARGLPAPAKPDGWSLETERFSAHLDELYATTSGWPYLVERALSECARRTESNVLRRLASELSAQQGQQKLLTFVGLLDDPRLSCAYSSIVALNDGLGLTQADMVAAAACDVSEPDPESIARCLLALDLFDLDDQGRYHPEPLVAAAWSARSSATGAPDA
jgi:hypothetical protein